VRSPARELLLYEQFRRGSFRVVACSGRYGIRPGMSLAEATALGNVECQEHDPLADRAALTKLAGWCEQFGPIVGIEEPDNLLVDVTGLGSLFGGEERLAEQVMRAFQRLGLTARVAIADTVGAAWAISHFEKEFPIVIPPGNTASALAILPVAALRISPSMIELLAELGLTQIGQLQSLPREAMAARFDPQLCLRLDQATGLMAEPILSHRPLPEITAHMQLEDSIRDRAALEVALTKLLDQISRQLIARQQGAVQLECCLQCETHQPTKLLIGLFRASAHPRHLLELTRLQLERLLLPGPVSAVSLAVLMSAPLTLWQPELFESNSRREIRRQAALLIDHLSNRLGRAAVVQAIDVPDAQPEFAFRYEFLTGIAARRTRPVGGESLRRSSKSKGAIGSANVRVHKNVTGVSGIRVPLTLPVLPGRKAGKKTSLLRNTGRASGTRHREQASLFRLRPVRLEREPLALEVLSVVPHGPPIQFYLQGTWQRVTRAWGPERIQTGWWRGRYVQRDYYRVETPTGARFWLFRRLSDETWFLHGVFD
jgi:protein ImuB